MIQAVVSVCPVHCPLVHTQARRLETWGCAQIQSGEHTQVVFDLSGVEAIDSSALAVLLAWIRVGQAANREVCFTQLPDRLAALIRLSRLTALVPVQEERSIH